MRIVKVFWLGGNIGVVVGVDTIVKKTKAYIGVGEGQNEAIDAIHISQHGTPLTKEMLMELVGAME